MAHQRRHKIFQEPGNQETRKISINECHYKMTF
jgi:hypothetical protein